MAWPGPGGNNNTAGIYFTNYFTIQFHLKTFSSFGGPRLFTKKALIVLFFLTENIFDHAIVVVGEPPSIC